MAPSSTKIAKSLYRSLLRTAQPFTESSSPDAAVLTSLLHRTGADDYRQNLERGPPASKSSPPAGNSPKSSGRPLSVARDLTQSYLDDEEPQSSSASYASDLKTEGYQRLFRLLLREVVSGSENGNRLMTSPSLVDTKNMKNIIRREFRSEGSAISTKFDESTRREVAFLALKELNKKLVYYDDMMQSSPLPIKNQAARGVSPLPVDDPSSYLQPGCFLISHPYLSTAYFTRSVICILDHQPEESELDDIANDVEMNHDDESSSSDWDAKRRAAMARRSTAGTTYGVIVNRVSTNPATGKSRTLRESFEKNSFPPRFANVFGKTAVKDGGPVHASLQMIYTCTPPATDSLDNEPKKIRLDDDDDLLDPNDPTVIGGKLVPMIPNGEESTAQYSNKATYYDGNVFKAMKAVEQGVIDRENISFFVGASAWEPGQLEREIERGYWIPCRGPPEIALHGVCDHVDPDDVDEEEPPSSTIDPDYQLETSLPASNLRRRQQPTRRPEADLWLSMLSACGVGEAKLAHLVHEEVWDENGLVCDHFDD